MYWPSVFRPPGRADGPRPRDGPSRRGDSHEAAEHEPQSCVHGLLGLGVQQPDADAHVLVVATVDGGENVFEAGALASFEQDVLAPAMGRSPGMPPPSAAIEENSV